MLLARLLAYVAVPLWLAAGCNFDALGLGSTSQIELPGTSSGSSDASTTEEDPDSGSTGPASTRGEPGSSSGGDPCPDGCPPMAAWTITAEGLGRALAIDAGGDAIVAGDLVPSGDAAFSDIWVARFAGQDGALVWQKRHDGGEERGDFARAITLTADGTIVVGGGSREEAARRVDVWVGWLAPADGQLVKSSNLATGHWNGEDPKLDEWAESVAITADGDLIVGGGRCEVPCTVPDAWIGRFDAEGATRWPDPMLSPGQGTIRAVTAYDGQLVGLGTDGYADTTAMWRSLIRRYDSEGAGTWSALPERSGDGGGFEAVAAAVGPEGGLWVVGREIDPDGGFVRLYMPDRSDHPVRERHAADLGGEPVALAIARDGSVVLAGAAGEGAARHLWLRRLSGELAPLWGIDEAAEAVREARGVAFDPVGALIVLGLGSSDDGGSRTWLRKYVAAPM